MSSEKLFDLDKAKCVKCGMCSRDCFFGALKMGVEGYPEIPNPARCMHCQHCFEICPTGAITFTGKKAEDSLPVEGALLPSAEAAENYMRLRRSTRRYADADVDKAVLERILKVLANSPTGCNARALKFTCVSNREAMNEFRKKFIRAIEGYRNGTKLLPRWLAVPAIQMRRGESDIFFRGATGMLIVSSDEKAPGVTTPNEDVVIACSQFEMLAQANGLGTCWCGFLRLVQNEVPVLLEKVLGFRQTTPFYAMLFGIPAVKYQRGIQRDDEAAIDWF